MSLGLTAEQLTVTYLDSLNTRLDRVNAEIQAIRAGESPSWANFLVELQKKMPNLPVEASYLMPIFLAFFDTIAANNKALAEAIPHLEV